jgi:pimeloyl-ACP methyl ester carboxylesterase
MAPPIERHTVRLHGHEVSYRSAGERGPLILLVHGITGSAATWDPVTERLARDHRVLVPDLLGHGDSAKPRGDYSLGAHAAGLRDLLIALGEERATVVGHSLGGGIAMQFAYQFAERVERLALVSSGGLGREVSLLLRAAALPGAGRVLPLVAAPWLLGAGAATARALGRVGLRAGSDLSGMAQGIASLGSVEARAAFIATVQSVIDPGGQRVNASDRLYLAAEVPTLIVWGERDLILPATHLAAARAALPHAQSHLFAGTGHMPQIERPDEFAALVLAQLRSRDPSEGAPIM